MLSLEQMFLNRAIIATCIAICISYDITTKEIFMIVSVCERNCIIRNVIAFVANFRNVYKFFHIYIYKVYLYSMYVEYILMIVQYKTP